MVVWLLHYVEGSIPAQILVSQTGSCPGLELVYKNRQTVCKGIHDPGEIHSVRKRQNLNFIISGLNNAWCFVQKLYLIVKKEVLYTGPLGLATYLTGSIFIDRKNSKEAYKLLERATEVMIQDKVRNSIVLVQYLF